MPPAEVLRVNHYIDLFARRSALTDGLERFSAVDTSATWADALIPRSSPAVLQSRLDAALAAWAGRSPEVSMRVTRKATVRAALLRFFELVVGDASVLVHDRI